MKYHGHIILIHCETLHERRSTNIITYDNTKTLLELLYGHVCRIILIIAIVNRVYKSPIPTHAHLSYLDGSLHVNVCIVSDIGKYMCVLRRVTFLFQREM